MNQIKLICSCGATAEFASLNFYDDIRKDATAWQNQHATCRGEPTFDPKLSTAVPFDAIKFKLGEKQSFIEFISQDVVVYEHKFNVTMLSGDNVCLGGIDGALFPRVD